MVRGAFYFGAIFVFGYIVVWSLISFGQSIAIGKPFTQCFMTTKNDCGRSALPATPDGGSRD